VTALPPELAPALRERAERLLAECAPATHREHGHHPQPRKVCWVCHQPGPLVFHHRVHGDDSTLVEVHARCHRRLHRKPKA